MVDHTYRTTNGSDQAYKPFLILGYPISRRRNSSVLCLVNPLKALQIDDLRRLRLPKVLRRVIDTVPRSLIKVNSDNNPSFLNDMKLALEDHTGFYWDWWPLQSPIRPVDPSMRRVQWTVSKASPPQTLLLTAEVGGHRLQLNVTETTWFTLQEILEGADEHPTECQCCIVKLPATSLYNIFKTKIRSSWSVLTSLMQNSRPSSQIPSVASQRYTPDYIPSRITHTGSNQSAGDGDDGAENTTPSPLLDGESPGASSDSALSSLEQERRTRILFAVQGSRWSLELSSVEMAEVISDSQFFWLLRRLHSAHRRTLCCWMSPFRFKNCRFVKVRLFRGIRVLPYRWDLK